MKTHLRYISISHKNAPVSCRERFFLSETAKIELAGRLTERFKDVSGLLFLFTCNRAEIYFEAKQTSAEAILKAFLDQKFDGQANSAEGHRFRTSDNSSATAKHLLRVSAGLESAVFGDAEIIHQIKKALHLSMRLGLQGSVLERSLQAVFRAHKRISNETAYRDGTTSTAYKSLKMIGKVFGCKAALSKKILLVGAGDIVRQLLAYNTKFGYRNIHITNRSPEKATRLAKQHGLQTWPWKQLEANTLESFDVIISAVSNRKEIIYKGLPQNKKTLLIDLAVPGNIDPALGNSPWVHWYDLDAISQQLERTKAARAAAVQRVESIIEAERVALLDWLEKQPMRALLASRKNEILTILHHRYRAMGLTPSKEDFDVMANRIVRKLLKESPSLQQTPEFEQWLSLHGRLPLAS